MDQLVPQYTLFFFIFYLVCDAPYLNEYTTELTSIKMLKIIIHKAFSTFVICE